MLYLLLGLSVVLLVRTQRAAEPFAAPAAFVAPIGFALVLIAQLVLLPLKVPSMNGLALGYLAAALVAMQAGYALARDGLGDAVARMMAGALLIGGVFAVACQVVQLFHLESAVSPFVVMYNIAVDRRPYGNMAQANHLATYIAFAMAGALYLVQTRRLAVWAWLALSIVLSAGLALTVSRGPWLQVAVMVVAGFWMAWVESLHARCRASVAAARRARRRVRCGERRGALGQRPLSAESRGIGGRADARRWADRAAPRAVEVRARDVPRASAARRRLGRVSVEPVRAGARSAASRSRTTRTTSSSTCSRSPAWSASACWPSRS